MWGSLSPQLCLRSMCNSHFKSFCILLFLICEFLFFCCGYEMPNFCCQWFSIPLLQMEQLRREVTIGGSFRTKSFHFISPKFSFFFLMKLECNICWGLRFFHQWEWLPGTITECVLVPILMTHCSLFSFCSHFFRNGITGIQLEWILQKEPFSSAPPECLGSPAVKNYTIGLHRSQRSGTMLRFYSA